MKKYILALFLCGISFAAAAQRETGYFVGAGAGMNFGFDGLKYEDRPTSHNGAGYAGDFYFGGWINPTIGLRAGYQGFGISDRYTDFGNRKYQYAHGDVLLRPHRNIIPYVHGGYLKIVNPAIGGGAGVMFPIHLTKHLSIVPDLKATGYNSKAFDSYKHNLAITLSATVGIALRFGHTAKKPATEPTVVVPVEPSPRDTVIVREVVREIVREVVKDTVYLEPKLPAELEAISALALFDNDSYVIKREFYPDLDRVVAWFNNHPDARAVIEGHTDSNASPAYNQVLSENRARAVFNYLVDHGVDASRLTWTGYGLTRPVDTNATAEGRQRNRRVEISVE
ncbi:MAG: OmpA family protein [Bacteroidales bacterium]|nr:OmpA family protein [Bacteroidales bacterium]